MTIASKIQKIIAKADSTTSDEEAHAFMAKAYQMMEEHGLSLMDLGRLDSDDPVGKTEDVYTSSENWKNYLAGEVARYYGCELVWVGVTTKSVSYTVFGRESARVTFQLMFPFILRQVMKLATAEVKAGQYKTRHRAMVALSAALTARVMKLRQANEVRHVGSGLNALVPVDMIQVAVGEAFPHLKVRRTKLNYDNRAQELAKNVSLNQQTPAPKSALKLGN